MVDCFSTYSVIIFACREAWQSFEWRLSHMARVASCPQCEHDLLVPDETEPSALVKCPQCRAFFELQHAASRELPSALIVESHPKPSVASTPVSKSLPSDDFSSHATLTHEREPISEDELQVEMSEADVLAFASENPQTNENPAPLTVQSLTDEPH